jgi:transposase-like protein
MKNRNFKSLKQANDFVKSVSGNTIEIRMEQEKKTINFGFANGWVSTPELVKECDAKKHPKIKYILSSCLTKYECPTCGYEYKIDSGD